MSENENVKNTVEFRGDEDNVIEFVLDEAAPSSSDSAMMGKGAELKRFASPTLEDAADESSLPVSAAGPVAVSPVFAALAAPTLPELPKQNRARLQMQSPNRLFFYWSIGGNPFQKLNLAVGPNTEGYSLVVRLIDLKRGVEKVYRIESEGSWWFDVDSESRYRAEIGFFAPNRPFVRVMFSNTVETPRKSPSPRTASASEWKVPAQRFADVLQVSGFARDAFDVAISGEDPGFADSTTRSAFFELVDGGDAAAFGDDYKEIRFALHAIASGARIEDLRGHIGPRLFSMLLQNASRLSSANVFASLQKHFTDLIFDEPEMESAAFVFGSSLINFPPRKKRVKLRLQISGYSPVSSRSLYPQ